MTELPDAEKICQWAGALIGVAGAFAVGCQTPRARFLGFAGFAMSNLLLIMGFWLMEAWPLLGMQAVFLLTSIRGMVTNHHADQVKPMPVKTQ